MATRKAIEKAEAIEKLQAILSKGDTLHTILRHVSASGMSRVISVVYVGADGDILSLDYLISQLGHYNRTPASSRHDGLKVSGVGMDMGFAVVYDVAQTIFNDGYALKQRWL